MTQPDIRDKKDKEILMITQTHLMSWIGYFGPLLTHCRTLAISLSLWASVSLSVNWGCWNTLGAMGWQLGFWIEFNSEKFTFWLYPCCGSSENPVIIFTCQWHINFGGTQGWCYVRFTFLFPIPSMVLGIIGLKKYIIGALLAQ